MNNCKIKEWTIRECELLDEMKDRCLNGGKYIDENAKEKFDMLCHLEDFSIQYYNLIEVIDKAIELIENVYNSLENVERPIIFYEKILEILKGSDSDV